MITTPTSPKLITASPELRIAGASSCLVLSLTSLVMNVLLMVIFVKVNFKNNGDNAL